MNMIATILVGLTAVIGASKPPGEPPKRIVWLKSYQIQLDTHKVAIKPIATNIKERTVQLPPYSIWASWRPDGVYALVGVPPSEGTPAHLEVLRRLEGLQTWDILASLPPTLNSVRAALPTDDGRLFLVPNGAFLQTPGADRNNLLSWAPFLILGRDQQGKWTRYETVDLGWGLPFDVPNGPNGKPNWSKATHRYEFLTSGRIETADLSDRLFELNEGWAVVDRHHGMVWVFDAMGIVKRHISIYETFKDEDLDSPLSTFPISVLACESAPDDKLLLAARNDTAFFYTRKAWPVQSDLRNQELASSYLLRQAQAAKDFPDLVWKEVDTKTGEVRTIPAPKGMPTKFIFRPENPNWHFHFQVGADGHVLRTPCTDSTSATKS